MSKEIKEIVILSDCSKDYKVGLEVYKAFTKDTNFEGSREIHPMKEVKIKENDFKIHFFAIQDSYWPAISNICRHCEGAVFAIDMENYTEEGGAEFIKEWLVNLEDLDKEDMKTVIIGVTQSESPVNSQGLDEINKISREKKIDYFELNIKKDQKGITDAFEKLAKLMVGDFDAAKKKEDDGFDEYLDKYKNF